jgi:hypothetical protein
MKGTSIFSKCALKQHLKMLRSVLQTASKNLKLNYSIQQNKKLGSGF